MLWMMRLASPDGSQEFSARIGRVTGIGIAANLRKNYPRPLHDGVLFVVAIANVFNLGADIGAMGSAWKERPLYLIFAVWFARRNSAGPCFDRYAILKSPTLLSAYGEKIFIATCIGPPSLIPGSCRLEDAKNVPVLV
jgi:hypothetical protein